MTEHKWDNFGEQIKNTVDDAIKNGDFSDLSRSIGNIINDTIETVKVSVKSNWTNPGVPPHRGTTPKSGMPPYSQYQTRQQSRKGQYTANQAEAPVLYQRHPRGKVSGILMSVCGYVLTVVFGIILLVFLIMGIVGLATLAGVVIFGALAAASLVVGIVGTSRLGLTGRFQRYVRFASQMVYVPISMLADKTGKSVEYVTRDLKKMIDKRMFFQAHIDEEEHCLILSDEAYKEYMDAKQAYRDREKAKEEARRAKDELPGEVRKLIQDGEAYIKHIRWCNEQIPGTEISQKLNQMENVVTRIFAVVQERPQVASELNKLMSYYLPTTKKLLDAYRELDHQPAAGENIITTKREIEDAIDTLNVAFEKLLDSLFVDKAWDISSDISVLNTVLAQDGLKDDGLKIQKPGNKESR